MAAHLLAHIGMRTCRRMDTLVVDRPVGEAAVDEQRCLAWQQDPGSCLCLVTPEAAGNFGKSVHLALFVQGVFGDWGRQENLSDLRRQEMDQTEVLERAYAENALHEDAFAECLGHIAILHTPEGSSIARTLVVPCVYSLPGKQFQRRRSRPNFRTLKAICQRLRLSEAVLSQSHPQISRSPHQNFD